MKAFGGAMAKVNAAEFVGKMEAEGKVAIDLDGETFEVTKDLVDIRISARISASTKPMTTVNSDSSTVTSKPCQKSCA